MPEYTRGVRRKRHLEHGRITAAIGRARKRGDHVAVRALRKQQRRLPGLDPNDPDYRRLRYVRYADDILLGFIGPRSEAEEIKRRLAQFLREELALELSETKTLNTHARTSAARFLGYEITVQHNDRKITACRRSVNGGIRLSVPREVIATKCVRYMQRGKPAQRPELVNEEVHAITERRDDRKLWTCRPDHRADWDTRPSRRPTSRAARAVCSCSTTLSTAGPT